MPVSQGNRTKESKKCVMFLTIFTQLETRTKESNTCVPLSREFLETRPKESKHVCKLSGVSPSATTIGGEVSFACEGRSPVDVPTAPHFL